MAEAQLGPLFSFELVDDANLRKPDIAEKLAAPARVKGAKNPPEPDPEAGSLINPKPISPL